MRLWGYVRDLSASNLHEKTNMQRKNELKFRKVIKWCKNARYLFLIVSNILSVINSGPQWDSIPMNQYRNQSKWSRHQACWSPRRAWKPFWLLDDFLWSEELDSVILVGSFKLWIFYNSVIAVNLFFLYSQSLLDKLLIVAWRLVSLCYFFFF